MNNQYVIRSTERQQPNCYFVAIHGYSLFYSALDQARRFPTQKEAADYAIKELFNDVSGFSVEATYQAE